jgi:hypothetical protein
MFAATCWNAPRRQRSDWLDEKHRNDLTLQAIGLEMGLEARQWRSREVIAR